MTDASLSSALQSAQEELDPRFRALRATTSALKQATRLANAESVDALAMQKALLKLEQAQEMLGAQPEMDAAVAAFAAATSTALDALAFDFARELRELFRQRGIAVGGRPPQLTVDDLVLEIDMATRKGQWFYGKEALTRPIPLSYGPILKAFDTQQRAVLKREIDVSAFLLELHRAWETLLARRAQAPQGKRINIIEVYSQVVLDRQSARFWNAPARATFRDYERAHFVRDLVLSRQAPVIEVEGKPQHLRLGGATKNQAESAARSIWLPSGPLDGDYYANLTFESD